MPVSYAAIVTHRAVAGHMTSEERHKNRYQRRKESRQSKRKKRLDNHGYSDVIALDSLDEAADLASKGVRWKASVQRYRMNKNAYIYDTHNHLRNGDDIRKGFNSFYINERGKTRYIQSVHFSERVVQKSICRNALIPVLTQNLIHDNGASQENKGTKFTMDRLKIHLQRHFRHHGRKGGILLIDLHDYFGSIDHEKLKDIYRKTFTDKELLRLAFRFIDAFDRGLGLGSEVSQISAIAYPDRIDHYIKEILRIKGYGRFMDDSYLIHEDTEYLKECLDIIREMYKELGIELNEDKTRICDLKHGFTFLKTKYFITDKGRIIMKPCRDAITRERRKLKKQARLVNEGTMTFEQVRTSYTSWRGSMQPRNAHRTVQSMDQLFNKLFIENREEWR